jgi:hypothetical protein
LVGSTRFKAAWEKAATHETLKGNIVLQAAIYPHSDRIALTHAQKELLEELQLAKIDISDEVMVINVNGYIGESTRAEILYAMKKGLPIRYLIPEKEIV